MMMKNKKYLVASVLSGLLFWLAWPMQNMSALIFFAFIPLLFIEDDAMLHHPKKSKGIVFRFSFLAFLIWNIASTYWVWNASAGGMIFAVILNSTLMSLAFLAYHFVKKRSGKFLSNFAFVFCWIGMEYFHMTWDLSWPWLTIGNVFSEQIRWVQWYEYTGVFGGSAWVLTANILLFNSIQKSAYLPKSFNAQFKNYFNALMVIVLPIAFSYFIFNNYEEKINPANIVIAQPNVDPYSEKFSGLSEMEQLQRLIKLSDSTAQNNTEFFVWPETALQNNVNESAIEENQLIQESRIFLEKYKNASIITGADAYTTYDKKETITARNYANGECCYDAFNSAFFIENNQKIQIYHKSKLVPGVEQMPYPKFFSVLEPYAVKLGGTFGSLGSQEARSVFYTRSGIGVAPVICYESIYGEFVSKYVQNGAQLITIITNDGWWGNTAGYKQHASIASLRAIETRRSVARSANTGISSFINQRGEVIKASEYWVQDSLNENLNLNDEVTFYVEHGDYIAFSSALIALLLLAYTITIKWLKKF